jgi:hypothetical protein
VEIEEAPCARIVAIRFQIALSRGALDYGFYGSQFTVEPVY